MRLTNEIDVGGKLGRALSAIPDRRALTVLVLAFAAILAIDGGTGSAPVQHLYYLPITFAAIRFGTRGGTIAAVIAIVLYHVGSPHVLSLGYGESAALQTAVFIAVGVTSARLAEDGRRLHALAMTDDLTGLHNLRSFEAQLASMVRAARRERSWLTLLVLDVDRLKSLNDLHGHLAGAEAVQTVGRLIAGWTPPGAAACRYGGDEFVVALPRCDLPRASRLADELRGAVNAAAPLLAGIAFPAGTLSISIGLACRLCGPSDTGGATLSDVEIGEAIFRAADRALYAAKNEGRNRTSVA